ncbi:MAG: cytochrome c oxidase subunit 3 [Thermoplasmatota archaeon]
MSEHPPEHAHSVWTEGHDPQASGDHAHEEPHLPHGSWWPFWMACSIAVLGFSVLLFGHGLKATSHQLVVGGPHVFDFAGVPLVLYAFLAVGVLLVILSLIGWVRQDTAWWNTNTGTGLHVPKAGILLFISSEIFLFGGLFAAYFTYRGEALSAHQAWPDIAAGPDGAFSLPLLRTFIFSLFLFASSYTVHQAERRLKAGNRSAFQKWWIATIALGAVFLGGQVYEYASLIREGHTLGSAHFMSAFFMLTGTHGLHVLGGLCALTIVAFRSGKGQFDAKRHAMPECVSLYWHFVDIVWVFVFGILYLWNFLPLALHTGHF